MEKTRIVLVEDHEEYRRNMEFLLNSNGDYCCRSFPDFEHARPILKEYNPHVVILDINLPGANGIEAAQAIKKLLPEAQIMMCTVYEDDDKIFDALKSGASGYILKRAPVQEIFDAVKQLLTGGSPMSPSIARKVVESFQPKTNDAAATLSDRENQILDLLATGMRLKEIADKLYVSVNTVRTHIRHIYEKLQVQSRVEALNKTGKSRF